MNEIAEFLRRASIWSIGLVFAVAGAVFAFSFFLALLLVAAFGIAGALLGGRKPTPLVLWERWREMRARNPFSAGHRGFARDDATRTQAGGADVVDVEAREVADRSAARGARSGR